MAVAFDAFSNHSTGGTGDLSWTHTPVGTPRAVKVDIVSNGSTAQDEVIGVTYGGVAMTEVSGSPNIHTSGEQGSVYTYVLVSGIPTGPQTVAVDVDATGLEKQASCTTLTAGADCEVVDSDGTVNSGSSANPSVTLSLGGKTCFCSIVFHSGQNSPANITPLTGWTSRLEFDFGNQNAGYYTYNTISTADVTAGWTQTAEDATMVAVAIAELAAVNLTSWRPTFPERFPVATEIVGY